MKTFSLCLFSLATMFLWPHLVASEESSFQESQTIGSLANLSGALVDLDNDDDLDIYLSNYVGQSQVWFNDGQGFFAPGEFFGLSFAQELTVADFNGDSFPDVFLPSNGIPSSLWFSDGSGQFTMSQQSMTHTGGGEVAAGDFDDDGDLDLFLGRQAPIENSVAFNDGTGVFAFPNGVTVASPYPVAVGDLDSDGDLDAIVARGGLTMPLGDLVLFNDGHGLFQLQSPTGLGSSFATDVELADFDADGDLDAFVTNLAFNGSSPADLIWINDGSGNFSDSGQALGNEDSYDLAVADLDSDGDIDVLVNATDARQRLWLNDGNGIFDRPIIVSQISSASDVLLGDIDADGDVDAVIVAFDSTRVLKNNTTRDLGDVNRDGKVNLLDIVPFVDLLTGGRYQIEADINQDGVVNLLDVAPFVELLSGG